jgi:LuxR family maltose regulon positive regulatory protein
LADTIDSALRNVTEKKHPVFRIKFLGKMEVYRDDTLITSWKYRPVQRLFQILVLNKGKRLHREEIGEILWPKSSVEKSSARVYSTLSRLRKIIEPHRMRYSKYSAVKFEKEYCWIETSCIVSYDVEEFLEFWRIGRINEKEDSKAAIQAYQHAIDLYKGDFLVEEQYVDWVEQERRKIKERYIEILLRIAAFAVQKGEYAEAIVQYKRILNIDPCHEHSHAQLMLCYIKINDRKSAIQQYRRCEQTLRQTLGLNPSSETKRLFETILT